MSEYTWELKSENLLEQAQDLGEDKVLDKFIHTLLENRGIGKESDIKEFLDSSHPADLPLSEFGLSTKNLDQAVEIIYSAIEEDRTIVIHGDFDADGVCAAAILWKTIYRGLDYGKCLPFIPDRFEQGYGVSEESLREITNNKYQISNKDEMGLLITVDCGITAEKEIKMAQEMGWEVLITDHHQKSEDVPKVPTLWTDQICGAGIAWLIAKRLVELKSNPPHSPATGAAVKEAPGAFPAAERLLGLVALATVADVEPLLGPNRSFVKYGLQILNERPSVGMQELMKVAGIEQGDVGTYELGWLLAPRINAAGRLESAMDSLRLLCTTDRNQAKDLAVKLNRLNNERQEKTESMLSIAQSEATTLAKKHKLLVVSHQEFHEGVLGILAGRLVREFYLPSIAISENKVLSKGSARSVSGFNIVEALRELSHLLEGVGGHPMAAGFTIKTERIQEFKKELLVLVSQSLGNKELNPELAIDMQIPLSLVSWDLWEKVKMFEPFGNANPRPLFCSCAGVVGVSTVGRTNSHLKLKLTPIKINGNSGSNPYESVFSAIGFGMGDKAADLRLGDKIQIAYSLLENCWNGSRSLQLKAKDIRKF